nr:MAG TPA: hypothetical protein [Caudoviricetes sp.]
MTDPRLTGKLPAPHILHNPLKAFRNGRPFLFRMAERQFSARRPIPVLEVFIWPLCLMGLLF